MLAFKIFAWFYQNGLANIRLNLQMDRNLKKFQHSASVFNQRQNFFKYSAFGFGQM